MVEAVVEYDYTAREQDELTLKKGDTISNIELRPGGWSEGTLVRTGKRGMFPDNFVKVIGTGDKKAGGDNALPAGGGEKGYGRCRVMFSYKPSNSDELELHVGDIIEVVGHVEEGWWKGTVNSKSGVFPSNFVEVIEESTTDQKKHKNQNDDVNANSGDKEDKVKLTSGSEGKTEVVSPASDKPDQPTTPDSALPALPPKPMKEMCRVMYPYKAANEDELSLEKGDIITILSKDAQDEGWWLGELKGTVGVFPDNFVQLITSSEEPKPERPPVKNQKGKDSISKSSSSASVYMSAASSVTSITRKFSDSVKPEEKSAPPIGKKPMVPPPTLKKPITPEGKPRDDGIRPASLKTSTTTEEKPSIRHSISSDLPSVPQVNSALDSGMSRSTGGMSVQNISTRKDQVSSNHQSGGTEAKWTVVETKDSTDGISWSSSRQMYSISSSSVSCTSESGGIVLTSASRGRGDGLDVDLDIVSRSGIQLKHPTASRAKVPNRRPPTQLLREDNKESGEEETGRMVNGSVEQTLATETLLSSAPAASTKLPWVDELKLNQAKKSLTQGSGKTRVMIRSSDEESVKGGKVSGGTVVQTVTMRPHTGGGQRPLSLHTKLPEPSPDSPLVTLPLAHWHDLTAKVNRLEAELEAQRESFSTSLKEVLEALEAQGLKQRKMMSELERLTDIVTQV